MPWLCSKLSAVDKLPCLWVVLRARLLRGVLHAPVASSVANGFCQRGGERPSARHQTDVLSLTNAPTALRQVEATLEPHDPENKPKAYIHWVSSCDPAAPPREVELRV